MTIGLDPTTVKEFADLFNWYGPTSTSQDIRNAPASYGLGLRVSRGFLLGLTET